MDEALKSYKAELEQELENILDYWRYNTIDDKWSGFVGKIDNENNVIPNAPKGSVLNARILWSFSAGYNQTKNTHWLDCAHRGYGYIMASFIDPEHDGVFWLVDHIGNPADTKKQVYATAFTIYAMVEFYKACQIVEVLDEAINLYKTLVIRAYDTRHTGYLEAFTREWQPIADLRLSAKDANEKKSMNTHLHVLEAYTTLYTVWADEGLRKQIETLLRNFTQHIIYSKSNHLILFFDEEWNAKSDTISYGHDIEATWLLLEAAEAIRHPEFIEKIKAICIEISEATLEGLDADGGLWYEYEPATNHLIKEKHWWPQAEAMVGFYNAYQITGDEKWLNLSMDSWEFIKKHILDKENGEWFWGIYADGSVMKSEDKAGLWKCPYHNSRACLEVIKRIG